MSKGMLIVGIIILAIITFGVVNIVQNYQTGNELDYYLLKETTEAAMTDAVDVGYYRLSGLLRIDKEKFVESFVRRFSQNVSNSRTYDIRFYDINEGKIRYDGININKMKKDDLRRSLGMVLQDTHLFTGTIKDNIKYGNENITDEDVDKALEVAQATEFVSKLKGGVDYDISQGGTNVSGGQKQRLSIARAIAKDPDIYVFDDSFSALDFKTDAKLRGELAKITKDKTVLIVAQRISTIMNADKIVVLNEGSVVGIGTHKELMKNCNVYKEIALSQLSKEELENA